MQESNTTTNKRIAKNTVFLFFRTLFILFITLYTSRVVLQVLGVVDYGIYNVVGGVVAMLAFLNSALVQATQRYITFAQGQTHTDQQKEVFTTSFYANLCIAIVVFAFAESIGLWYVNNKVVLPQERLYAANFVYQFSILIFLTKIVVVPYMASVVAHEHMHVYAGISVADALFQLFAVTLLDFIATDSLILFSLLQFIIALVIFLLYFVYCRTNYVECVLIKMRDWKLFKEMYAFAGWAFLGGFGFVARGQGVNLVLNLFCGPAVNAARAVAYQVSSAVQSFVSSFLQSINPQITKRYAKGEKESMMLLVKVGAKYTFLALLICCTPVMIRANYILSLWLGNVPEYSALFLVLALCMSLITSMGTPLNTAMQATGNIKLFQIVVAVIMCLDIPFSYVLLMFGIEPYLVTSVSILTAFLCLVAKLFILNRLIRYSISSFFFHVIVRNIFIALVMIPSIYIISQIIPQTFGGLVLLCVLSVLGYCTIIFLIGMEKWERKAALKMANKLKHKFQTK